MKIDNTGYIIKGILLAVCGVLFAFFPGVLSWIFYIIGGIIIVSSLLTGFSSLGGDGGSLMPAGIVGVLIGLFVLYIPKFISKSMSVIAGLILTVISITQIVKALSKELTKGLKIFQLIFGIFLLIASVFLIFNPFHGGKVVRFLVGLLMLAFAAFNFYVAYVISERNGEVITSNDVIDANGFEVHDNNDQKRIQ
ncbi:MAG: DUF308 domain-containing protein [Ruminococcus sp.]|uniref:DUF308 domain-containing protein n=1 Tax=Ruminococcus sp. TaxID=41978 RepID=UPI001B146CB7|nr:DUF308 domain-containing protein [Ruminococcus sp.]MBO7474020.1 DUF308 domain-containing protein [Ruminococcus sp.]